MSNESHFVCFRTIHKLLWFIWSTRHHWTNHNVSACIGCSALLVEEWFQEPCRVGLFAKLIIIIVRQHDKDFKVSVITYVCFGNKINQFQQVLIKTVLNDSNYRIWRHLSGTIIGTIIFSILYLKFRQFLKLAHGYISGMAEPGPPGKTLECLCWQQLQATLK